MSLQPPAHSCVHNEGESRMQETLMVSLAASIMLGMWVIWKMTP
jgi:hypothetical protein